ncbi:response regulator [Sphingomonas sp. GCM10030256]|uniref:response regulator n=1 Tax=Sphingomonas sp. GCM10030256 TaxID=3273427 RepID=UPI00360F8B5F
MNVPLRAGPVVRPEVLDQPVERPRVLVVDDDERNLLAIETVLEDVGEVVVARSGEEALRHLLKGEFAVILLDVYMPGMDGYETAQVIRQREQTKRIPIVFLSAVNKEAEHLMRGYAMGAVDYVFKPVDAVVLRSKVAVFVDLFAKTKEIERKARQEQALLDAALQANAERLSAERELRRAQGRQAAIIQSLPIILYLEPLTCETRCPHFVSGSFEAMTGYRFAEVLENPRLWAERLHDEDRARVLAAVAERDRTGRLSVEYRWRCADGTYKHFHDQAVLLKDDAGVALEFAGTLTDVSDRKSLENQLVQAQKMDAIGKLTGGIAHDFNNLLAAVLGGIGLVERRANLADEHRKILGMTRHAAEQGTDLVGRLLAFARRQQLKPGKVPPRELAEAVNNLLAHTLGGLVELDWSVPNDAWPAYADAAQLELALMNLIINARDAMPEGGTIRITAANRGLAAGNALELPAGDYVFFEVVDHGCGIAPENLEKVLEPFFTTKEVGKGTGLGLSMVYGFARQSGGAFQLSSKPGEGTSATICLPRAVGAEGVSDLTSVRADSVLTTRPLRILLVDDHPGVRAMTAAMLHDLGHKVTEACNGVEALELLEQQADANGRLELVISDYAMPHLSGMEVVRRVRERQPDLPALLITGYADTEEIGQKLDQMVVLAKPFTLGGLSAGIAEAVRRDQG